MHSSAPGAAAWTARGTFWSAARSSGDRRARYSSIVCGFVATNILLGRRQVVGQTRSPSGSPHIHEPVEREAARSLAATGLFTRREPHPHPPIPRARPAVSLPDAHARAGHFLLVHEIWCALRRVQARAQQGRSGADGHRCIRVAINQPRHRGALQLDLAVVARHVDRDERDPVLWHRAHDLVAHARVLCGGGGGGGGGGAAPPAPPPPKTRAPPPPPPPSSPLP